MSVIEIQILKIKSGIQINRHPERLIIQLNTSLVLTRYSSNVVTAIFVSVFVLFLSTSASADPPEVDSIIAPTEGLEGLTLTYTVSNVTDPDGDTVDTTWDFGDGTGITSNESTFNTYHTFNNDGVYLVSLTMVDSNGETISTNWSVTISNRAPFIYNFTIPDQGGVGETLSFTILVSDLDAVEVLWEFCLLPCNDSDAVKISGGNLNPFEAKHSFSVEGTYNVTVTATDGDGASTQFVRIIEIIIPAEEKDMRDVLSDYVIISFVVLYSVYSMWRRRKAPNSKD